MQSADYTQHTQFFSVTIFAIFWFKIQENRMNNDNFNLTRDLLQH